VFRGLVELKYLDRNHWSLFPVFLEGRNLPNGTYDKLMGMLVGGCMGTSMSEASFSFSRFQTSTIGVLTSKFPTTPYDDVTMLKMIKLVQKAKGTSFLQDSETRHIDFQAQSQKVLTRRCTTPLEQVSTVHIGQLQVRYSLGSLLGPSASALIFW